MMQMNDPLNNTAVSIGDFNLEHCKAIIQNVRCSHVRHSSCLRKYQNAFECATNDTQYSESEQIIWSVLSRICSVCFEPKYQKKGNGEYKPHWIMNGGRSCLPEDLNEYWQTFIRTIALQLDDYPLIQGRLLDVCYVAAVRKNFQDVQPIITAFAQTDVLTKDGHDCWWRMLGLLKNLREVGAKQLEVYQQTLFNLFEAKFSAPPADEHNQLKNIYDIARMSYEHRLFTNEQRKIIADELKEIGLAQLSKEKFLWSDDMFSLAHDYYKWLHNDDEKHEMLRQRARAYMANGDARLREDDTAFGVQQDFYEKALQVLRSLPKKARKTRDTEKIKELLQKIPQLGQQSLGYMKQIKHHLDVTELTESAKEMVRGCGLIESLQCLVDMSPFSYSQWRKVAKDKLSFFMDYLFSDHLFAENGRTVAKRTSMDIDSEQSVEQSIWKKMVELHHQTIALRIVGIVSALDVILSEHSIRIEDLLALTTQSKFVPVNRRYAFAKGLMFGFEYDFSSALYCLIPQIEHMVRDALKQRNIITTTKDRDGVETEIGLSALLDNHHEKCVEVFGEDVTYEMKMLLCDAWGANLRNMVAHGLLDDNESSGDDAIYAWWFAFKLVILGCLKSNEVVNNEG